jgi:SsrA-binding protein
MARSNSTDSRLADNRKAFRDYIVLEKYEAGIQLSGTEVKSARDGHISFTGSYAGVKNGEMFLYKLNITPYDYGNRFNHEPDRTRKLLMKRREITRLQVELEKKGLTFIPLKAYLRRDFIKIELGLCKGKTYGDKRETLRRRTADREAARAIATHVR